MKIIGCSCVASKKQTAVRNQVTDYWSIKLTGIFPRCLEGVFSWPLKLTFFTQDYPCTPGTNSQLEPYALYVCMWVWCFSLGGVSVFGLSLPLLRSLASQTFCISVSVCMSECAYDPQMGSSLPSQVRELPSNITHGLCFDPLASHSPQPPLKPVHTELYVGHRDAQCPLKPFVLQIYTILPLFPLPISPLLIRQRVECWAYNGRTRLGCVPSSLCHHKSQRYTPLAASSQLKAFFKAGETVALTLVPVNPH